MEAIAEKINPKVNHFTDLLVWQQSRELTKLVYQVTYFFPREEIYGLTNQMRRAVISVPSNIAEGHSRESLKEYLHHLSIAIASLAELQAQLILSVDLEFITQEKADTAQALIEKTFRMLKNLQKSLKQKLP